MVRRLGLGVMLLAGAVVEAAEPVPVAPAQPAATPAPAPAEPPAAAAPAAAPKAELTKPLDLRIGDIRRYMMPNEFRDAVNAPDEDQNTVVVEGRRELLPVDSEKPIPMGPLMPLWWAVTHPANSWRILLPDINRGEEGPREPEDKVPPPVFRWGP